MEKMPNNPPHRFTDHLETQTHIADLQKLSEQAIDDVIRTEENIARLEAEIHATQVHKEQLKVPTLNELRDLDAKIEDLKKHKEIAEKFLEEFHDKHDEILAELERTQQRQRAILNTLPEDIEHS